MNLCSCNSPYSLNCHVGAMLMFHMLCRITQSSDVHRTESVSVMDHEQTMGLEKMEKEDWYYQKAQSETRIRGLLRGKWSNTMVQILRYFAFHTDCTSCMVHMNGHTKHHTSRIAMHSENDHWLAKHFQCSKLLLLHHKSGFLCNLLIHNIGQYIDSNTESNQPVPSCWWSTLSQVLFPIFPHHRFQVSFLP